MSRRLGLVRRLLPAALWIAGAACGEAGLPLPRDPGTVHVRVRDEQGAPVPGTGVRVQMPNASGGVFEVGTTTRADGTTTITAVPAGSRRVTVTPPTGYAPGAEPLVRVVEVVRGQTVQVDFSLRRGTGAARLGRRRAPAPVAPPTLALQRTAGLWEFTTPEMGASARSRRGHRRRHTHGTYLAASCAPGLWKVEPTDEG